SSHVVRTNVKPSDSILLVCKEKFSAPLLYARKRRTMRRPQKFAAGFTRKSFMTSSFLEPADSIELLPNHRPPDYPC
ncbi:hypothetical protein, partial [Sutterella wadsworthensis]|uniref:hypothetical protein n=1 Tax=Sutterella wadsworthensis TaxID=40545 RepID=UPI0030770746